MASTHSPVRTTNNFEFESLFEPFDVARTRVNPLHLGDYFHISLLHQPVITKSFGLRKDKIIYKISHLSSFPQLSSPVAGRKLDAGKRVKRDWTGEMANSNQVMFARSKPSLVTAGEGVIAARETLILVLSVWRAR